MEQDRIRNLSPKEIEWRRISREREAYWDLDKFIFGMALRSPNSMAPEIFDLIRSRWEARHPHTSLNLDRWMEEYARPRHSIFTIEDNYRKFLNPGIDYTDPFLTASRAVINFIEHSKNPPSNP